MGDNLYYPYVYYHYPEPQPIAEIVMKGDEDVNTAQTPCFDDSANMASYYSYPYDSVNAESNLKDMPLEAMSGYSQYQQPEYPPVPHLGHLPLPVDPSLDQNHLPSPQTDNEYSFDDTVSTKVIHQIRCQPANLGSSRCPQRTPKRPSSSRRLLSMTTSTPPPRMTPASPTNSPPPMSSPSQASLREI